MCALLSQSGHCGISQGGGVLTTSQILTSVCGCPGRWQRGKDVGGCRRGERPERLSENKDSVRDLLVSAERKSSSLHGQQYKFLAIFTTFDLAIAMYIQSHLSLAESMVALKPALIVCDMQFHIYYT